MQTPYMCNLADPLPALQPTAHVRYNAPQLPLSCNFCIAGSQEQTEAIAQLSHYTVLRPFLSMCYSIYAQCL